ncbi:MAG: alpha/beta fold hydrolase [Vicinamibacterales bacterium]
MHPRVPPPITPARTRFLAGVTALALAGATAAAGAQAVPTLTDRRVDAAGTTIRLRCGGVRVAGAPIVIFEAGAFNTVETWRDVHAPIAALARACAVDRPGRGGSGPPPPGLDADGYVALLAGALAAGGEAPPYVLVGHSLGGLIVQLYAARRPGEVAGVVLVDSSHPDQVRRMADLPRPPASPPSSTSPPPPEAVGLDAWAAALGHAPPALVVPLAVVTRSRWTSGTDSGDDAARLARWGELQRDLAAHGRRARHDVAADSGHYVQNDEPRLVIDAVRWVLANR